MRIEPKRAIVTVPYDLREQCWGKPVDAVENRYLRACLREATGQFIEARQKHGQQYLDRDDVHVYGPFPSPVWIDLLDHEELLHEAKAQLVREHGGDPLAFNHYVLNAHFIVSSDDSRNREETTIGSTGFP